MKPRITLALVGLNFGRHIVESELLNGRGTPYIELCGICDYDQAKAAGLAAEYKLRHYRSLEEILKDPAIEAVALYTPPHGRAEVIEQCLLAGKHVMTTKPFEDDPAAAEQVFRLARRRGQVIHLNSPAPLPCDEFVRFEEWRQEYAMGRPVMAFWETHARYHEKADGSWQDDPELCPAAPIFRLGIYGISDLVELCGPVAECKVVQSRTETGRPTVDNGMMSIRFKNGCIGCIASSFRIDNGMPYRNTLIVHYEYGTVTRSLPGTVVPDDRILISLHTRNTVKQETLGVANRSGQYQWGEFARAIQEGRSISENYIEHVVNTVELLVGLRAQAAGLKKEKIMEVV